MGRMHCVHLKSNITLSISLSMKIVSNQHHTLKLAQNNLKFNQLIYPNFKGIKEFTNLIKLLLELKSSNNSHFGK